MTNIKYDLILRPSVQILYGKWQVPQKPGNISLCSVYRASFRGGGTKGDICPPLEFIS